MTMLAERTGICCIPYSDIMQAPNSKELFDEYCEECAIEEIGKAAPQASIYEAMQSSGAMKFFGAYQQGKLLGFASLITYTVPHYGKKIAAVESLFVAKASRPGVGTALMESLEEYAGNEQCAAILYSAPSGSRLEALLDHLKSYRRTNSVFTRKLQ